MSRVWKVQAAEQGAEMRPQSMSSTAASAAAVTVTGRLSARAQAKDSAKRPPGRISPMTTRWPSVLVRLTCTWPVSTAPRWVAGSPA